MTKSQSILKKNNSNFRFCFPIPIFTIEKHVQHRPFYLRKINMFDLANLDNFLNSIFERQNTLKIHSGKLSSSNLFILR